MPEFDFSGNFVNENNVQDGDILTICAMPVAEEKESAQQKVMINNVMKPLKYMVLNIPVDNGSAVKQYTPDSKTGLRFQEAWGKDYALWIGKQFSVELEEYKAYGADKVRVAGFPINEKK
jgi:hypothetical protein